MTARAAVAFVLAAAVASVCEAAAARAGDYDWRPVRVVDGDTIAFDAGADIRVPELAAVKVRLRGVDTPETWRPACDAERRRRGSRYRLR